MNIGLVLGKFHQSEVEAMRDEAHETAAEHSIHIVAIAWTPGAMEFPLAAKRFLEREDINALAVLGIIERGETRHGIVMAQAVINALIGLQLQFMKPIGVGILGPEIFPSQVPERLRPYARSAVQAAHHMLKADRLIPHQAIGLSLA
jgi:6,7-dimethyl-8-ribityllumazine synthase